MKRLVEYLLACMGTATVATLAVFYLNRMNVAAGYAAIMVLVLMVAWRTRLPIFLYQSLILLGVAAFRISMTNLSDLRNAVTSDQQLVWSTVTAILVLLAGVVLAFSLRVPKGETETRQKWITFLIDHPEQPMFFVPVILMGVFLFIRMPDRLALGWAIEGVAIFILALLAKERSFRLTGLGLLMICFVMTIWTLVFRTNSQQTRYLTLIVLGVIFLAVSFLYGRFRETLREFL
jgi:hypothetical protein